MSVCIVSIVFSLPGDVHPYRGANDVAGALLGCDTLQCDGHALEKGHIHNRSLLSFMPYVCPLQRVNISPVSNFMLGRTIHIHHYYSHYDSLEPKIIPKRPFLSSITVYLARLKTALCLLILCLQFEVYEISRYQETARCLYRSI